jgi:hypothetical protein
MTGRLAGLTRHHEGVAIMDTVNTDLSILPVTFLNVEVADPMERLTGTPQALADLLLTYRATILQIKGDLMISDLAQRQQTDQATAGALDEVDRLLLLAEEAKARVERATAGALAEELPTQEAVLRELQEQRIWARQRDRLAALADPADLIRRAGEAGDLAALRVLRAELPAWLEAHEQPETAAATLLLIDQAELPLLPPTQRRARQLQAEVKLGWENVLAAVEWSRFEVSGQGQATVIPGWAKGSVIRVEQTMAMR